MRKRPLVGAWGVLPIRDSDPAFLQVFKVDWGKDDSVPTWREYREWAGERRWSDGRG